jgi:cation transport protein ChaC
MLALEPGADDCAGLAFRIHGALATHESALLWRREMIRGLYRPLLLPVQTPQGPVEAVVFRVNDSHPDHVGELPLDETAVTIARAAGVLGPNRQYLEQLVWQLEHLGLEDAYLQRLYARVRQID